MRFTCIFIKMYISVLPYLVTDFQPLREQSAFDTVTKRVKCAVQRHKTAPFNDLFSFLYILIIWGSKIQITKKTELIEKKYLKIESSNYYKDNNLPMTVSTKSLLHDCLILKSSPVSCFLKRVLGVYLTFFDLFICFFFFLLFTFHSKIIFQQIHPNHAASTLLRIENRQKLKTE